VVPNLRIRAYSLLPDVLHVFHGVFDEYEQQTNGPTEEKHTDCGFRGAKDTPLHWQHDVAVDRLLTSL